MPPWQTSQYSDDEQVGVLILATQSGVAASVALATDDGQWHVVAELLQAMPVNAMTERSAARIATRRLALS